MCIIFIMRLYLFSGLGDRDWLLRWAAVLWRLRGFKPVVWPLNWESNDGAGFKSTLEGILADIDALPEGEQVCIVGGSAGGVVATLIALMRPGRVRRVVAICSPLNRLRHSNNKRLNAALLRLSQVHVVSEDKRSRVASFRARQDDVVPPTYSILPGAANFELPSSGHALTIMLAHTIFGGRLAVWLKSS